MKEFNHNNCLVCGQDNPNSLGLRFRKSSTGKVTAKFTSTDKLQGYSDLMHGGVIATLLDSAMAHCLNEHGIVAVTGELNVRYLTSIPSQSELEIEAEICKNRAPLYNLTAAIFIKGKVAAKAKAKFMEKRVQI